MAFDTESIASRIKLDLEGSIGEATSRTYEDEKKQATLRPTLILGVGGTGGRVISAVKPLISAHYAQIPEHLKLVQYLLIDTVKPSLVEPAVKPLMDTNEYLYVGGINLYNAVTTMLNRKDSLLDKWWDRNYPIAQNRIIDQGAGRMRQVGRFILDQFSGQIENAINTKLSIMSSADEDYTKRIGTMETRSVTVYIVTSCCGGTGSGMFFDLGFLCEAVAIGKGLAADVKGIVLSPGPFFRKLWASGGIAEDCYQLYGNGLAFMREAEHFWTRTDQFLNYTIFQNKVEALKSRFTEGYIPFTTLYLIDDNPMDRPQMSYDETHQMAAQGLYNLVAEITGTSVANAMDGLASKSLQRVTQDSPGFSTLLASFGVSSFVHPVESINRYLVFRFLGDLVEKMDDIDQMSPEKGKELMTELDEAVANFMQHQELKHFFDPELMEFKLRELSGAREILNSLNPELKASLLEKVDKKRSVSANVKSSVIGPSTKWLKACRGQLTEGYKAITKDVDTLFEKALDSVLTAGDNWGFKYLDVFLGRLVDTVQQGWADYLGTEIESGLVERDKQLVKKTDEIEKSIGITDKQPAYKFWKEGKLDRKLDELFAAVTAEVNNGLRAECRLLMTNYGHLAKTAEARKTNPADYRSFSFCDVLNEYRTKLNDLYKMLVEMRDLLKDEVDVPKLVKSEEGVENLRLTTIDFSAGSPDLEAKYRDAVTDSPDWWEKQIKEIMKNEMGYYLRIIRNKEMESAEGRDAARSEITSELLVRYALPLFKDVIFGDDVDVITEALKSKAYGSKEKVREKAIRTMLEYGSKASWNYDPLQINLGKAAGDSPVAAYSAFGMWSKKRKEWRKEYLDKASAAAPPQFLDGWENRFRIDYFVAEFGVSYNALYDYDIHYRPNYRHFTEVVKDTPVHIDRSLFFDLPEIQPEPGTVTFGPGKVQNFAFGLFIDWLINFRKEKGKAKVSPDKAMVQLLESIGYTEKVRGPVYFDVAEGEYWLNGFSKRACRRSEKSSKLTGRSREDALRYFDKRAPEDQTEYDWIIEMYLAMPETPDKQLNAKKNLAKYVLEYRKELEKTEKDRLAAARAEQDPERKRRLEEETRCLQRECGGLNDYLTGALRS